MKRIIPVLLLLLLIWLVINFYVARIVFTCVLTFSLVAMISDSFSRKQRNKKLRLERTSDKEDDFINDLTSEGIRKEVAEFLFDSFLSKTGVPPRKNDILTDVYDFYEYCDFDYEIEKALLKIKGTDDRKTSYKHEGESIETMLLLAKEINKLL